MTAADEWLRVESLDLDAQGVAHDSAGKVVFIEGALPGEVVRARIGRRKGNWEQGTLTELRRESTLRVTPRCPHFGLHAGACGGCKMQHVDSAAQVAVKQRALEDSLWHIGKVRAACVLRPIEGPAWGYRHRARLSVRYVPKKGGVLVGFHERRSSYVADIRSCDVLPAVVSGLLLPLRELLGTMEARSRLPQIELAAADREIVLVLRHLEPLSDADLARLRAFASHHGVRWWLQPKGPESAQPLEADDDAALAYELPEFGVRMSFRPTDFTQVNPFINETLVSRAVRLLDPQPTERAIDWFSGLGNFTLPLATRAGEVLGVEGAITLVERGRDAALRNGLGARVRFEVCDLFELGVADLLRLGSADRWLVDPPREGALALVKALSEALQHPVDVWTSPRRIVYVSCNPATLARDAGLLVHQAGYQCTSAGVVNMFPHTAHVESLAVFDRGRGVNP
jgi:23S rRNA (uracil1939-C5)-methyltransferase